MREANHPKGVSCSVSVGPVTIMLVGRRKIKELEYSTNLVTRCPLLEGVSDKGGQFLCNVGVCLSLS